MFLGHYALGLAAKKIDNRPSLGTLIFASQFIDLLWPLLVLLNLEWLTIEPGITKVVPLNFTHYPISHSLAGVILWSLLFGGIYFLIKKNVKSSLLLSGLVLSHWLLDFISHRPDLPILPGDGLKVGLGLWFSLWGTLVVEGLLFAGGCLLFFSASKAKNKKGKYGLWVFIVFLTLVYLMNIFGSPPPSSQAIAWVGLSQWLLVIWGYWIDKNRE